MSQASWQDVGVWSYIDDNVNRVARVTTLNQSDLQLSADQNDVIHQAALKQMKTTGFVTDKSQAVSVKQSASGAMGSGDAGSSVGWSLSTREAGAGEQPNGADEEEAQDAQDEDDLDPQPFGGLFSRLAGSSAAAKKRAGPGGGAADKGDKGGKKRTTSTPTTTTPSATLGSSKAPKRNKQGHGVDSEQTTKVRRVDTHGHGDEDASILDSYNVQLACLRKLDVGEEDDFGAWAKDKTKKLTDLKCGIAAKKTSLKRRSGDSSQITEDLWSHCRGDYRVAGAAQEPADRLQRGVQSLPGNP